jgi:hypothetical protein
VPNGRPLAEEERPYLRSLGEQLKDLHQSSGRTWFELANASLISKAHLENVAYGRKRTRRSTLARIVDALVEANPQLGPAQELLNRLCSIAGPALAPESDYQARVERKLARRAKARERGYWIP